MAVSEKPRKKKSPVVAMPAPTPPVEYLNAEVMQITEDPIPKWYPIDWNKVSTVGDVKFILSNMGLVFSEDSPNYQVLKRYLSDTSQKIN
jgi:hypothetical protein